MRKMKKKKNFILFVVGILFLFGFCISVEALDFSSYVIQSHTTSDVSVNLFDYWVTEKDAADNVDTNPRENLGINVNHLLLFHAKTQSISNNQNVIVKNFGRWNAWQSSEAYYPVLGIVSDVLGEDGYPVLSISDEDIQATTYLNNRQNESLAYLFDTNDSEYKKSYSNVEGLFQFSSTLGDYYSCFDTFAEFSESENRFLLYPKPAVQGNINFGQFFPFNQAQDVFEVQNGELIAKDIDSKNSSINHYLGMSITADFSQPPQGQTYNVSENKSQDMVFSITGDDDIWVYIDDILVADLGGIHDALNVSINFSTGRVVVKPANESNSDVILSDTYLGDIYYNKTEKYNQEYMDSNFVKEMNSNGEVTRYTFGDNSEHTLKIFYLERGNSDSNLEVSFWPSINGSLSDDTSNDSDEVFVPEESLNPETGDMLFIIIFGVILLGFGFGVSLKYYQCKNKKSSSH